MYLINGLNLADFIGRVNHLNAIHMRIVYDTISNVRSYNCGTSDSAIPDRIRWTLGGFLQLMNRSQALIHTLRREVRWRYSVV